MDRVDTARQILEHAADELRGLIAEALDEQSYEEVAVVAQLTDRIAKLLHPSDTLAADDVGAGADGETARAGPIHSRRASSVNRETFPKFLRDGNRLVKVAWSKKERAEYEHRAPKEVALLLVGSVRAKKGEGVRFEMADVLPLAGEDGRDLPDYQVYVALAWLRQAGAITKHGRNGYRLVRGAGTPQHLTKLWESLPAAT